MKVERILVVDDHREAADMLAQLLQIRLPGVTAEQAYDGLSGLEAALGGQFDVVILDLLMPKMSGQQVAHNLRAAFGQVTPLLIALSGSVLEVARDEIAQDFDFAFAKPLKLDLLLSTLQGKRNGIAPA